MQIVILGMHRSGTSLTSSIVNQLGVHIGDRLLGKHPSQIRSHWEDVDFYELNMDILKKAGGDWRSPPTESRILNTEPYFRDRIKNLIALKNKRAKWGFKDPRTCLTLPLYLPHLTEPRFILVYRETDRIIDSLVRRSGGGKGKWGSITRTYQESMEKYTNSYDVMRTQYEHLVAKSLAPIEVGLINKFIDGNGQIEKALSLIEFRI